MPLTRDQKAKTVEELKDKLSRKKAAFFVSFTGVDVKTSQEFRRSLKKSDGEYKVAKKTLLQRALEGNFFPKELLTGQVGIVFDYTSEVNVAKVIADFTKKSSMAILGGIIDATVLSADQARELALLPDIDTMRARLAFVLISPLSGLLRTLTGVQLQFITTLKAIASKQS